MNTAISKITFVGALALGIALTACKEENSASGHADHTASQTICPVSGEELGSMGEPIVMMHEGKEVKLCCNSCIKKFNAAPATYAAKVQ